eukprot:gene14741-14537_t
MLAQLEQVCDRRLGSAGPSFTAAREALQALEVCGLDSDVQATAIAMDQIALSNMQATAGGLIRNRQQALGELRRVAAYFRSAEPHSPVAYLAEQAARWGELSLHGWLKEVVNDSGQLALLENLLGIGTRLGIGFAVVLLLLLAMTVVGLLRLSNASALTEEMINVRIRDERMIADWGKIIEVNAARTMGAVMASDPADQKALEGLMAASSAAATKIQDEIGKNIDNPELKTLFEKLQAARKSYTDIRKSVFALKAGGDLEGAKKLHETDMTRSRTVYLDALKKFSDRQSEELDEAAAEIKSQYTSGRMLLITLGVAAIVLGVTAAWWISRSITEPINYAVKVAETVSSGDLTSDIQVQ